jgi:PAS domain S-box-containing protein
MKHQQQIGHLCFTISGAVLGLLIVAFTIFVKLNIITTATLQEIFRNFPAYYLTLLLPVIFAAIFYFIAKKRNQSIPSDKDTVKKLLQELSLSSAEKNRFEQTMRMAKLGTWEIDCNNESFYGSPELKNIYHVANTDDFSLKEFYKNVHEDDITGIKKSIELSASTLQEVTVEYRYLINGEVHYMTSNISPRTNKNGKLTGYFGTVQDITTNKLIELALKQSEEEKAVVLNNTQTMICIHDMDGVVMNVNETGARMSGFSKNELIGRNFKMLIPGEYQDRYNEYLNKIGSTGTANGTLEIRTKEGNKRAWLYQNTIYKNNGDAPYVIASAIDITDSVKAKNEVEKQQQIIRQIIDSSPNVIYVLNEKQEIVVANKTFNNYYDYNADGRTLSVDLFKDHKDIFLADAAAIHDLEDGEMIKSEGNLKNIHDDSTHRFTVIKKCFKEKSGKKYLLCFCMDITERYQMEIDLKAANEIVERSLKVKDQFISNMSHEIRTPLNAVIGFTDLLTETPLTKVQENYIEIVKTASQTLLALINNILDLSKIESGNLTLEVLPIDVKQIIKDITRLFEPKAKTKNVQINTHISNSIPAKVLGDQLRLSQIIFNLLGNAVKFTEEGSIDIHCDLVKGPDKQKHYIAFSVKDTGIGVPIDKQGAIMERFTQANTDTQRLYGGSGLGLNIVKSIVDMYGGTLSMESKEDHGTEFHFILPFKNYVETQDTTEIKPMNGNKNQAVAVPHALNILLAEDNLVNAMLAKEVLTRRGFSVHHVVNGVLAVEAVQHYDFDLIIMDIQMPEMNGISATEKIRKLPGAVAEIPIIAMTAHSLHGEMQNCYNAGMNGYVSKPFKPDDLYAAIMECVAV